MRANHIALALFVIAAWPVCAAANDPAQVRAAIEHSLGLLQNSAPQFVKVSGCVSCHHQFLPLVAIAAARSHGLSYDSSAAGKQVSTILAFWRPTEQRIVEGLDGFPDMPINAGYALLALDASGHPPDPLTAAMVHNLAGQQAWDGRWPAGSPRPPMEHSDFTATALCIRALNAYGPPGRKHEFAERIARARTWLTNTQAYTTEDRAMQLLGLAWAGAPRKQLQRMAVELAQQQRPDGGWAQSATLPSDAYATGEVLVALHESAHAPAADDRFQQGIAFLLKSQNADGSWLVQTRALPIQEYRESGFPHSKNQWISASATSWASIALTLALPSPNEASPLTKKPRL